jgi:hypothetical protein
VHKHQTQESLLQRVNDILHGNPTAYAVVESKEESIEAIFNLLQRAEEELRAVRERVNRLKWALERARS